MKAIPLATPGRLLPSCRVGPAEIRQLPSAVVTYGDVGPATLNVAEALEELPLLRSRVKLTLSELPAASQ